MSRLEKSPLLANGYNHPPHLGHMQFMQLPHPAAAHSALLSPAMPHNLARHDGSVIKNQGMPTMEAIARSVSQYRDMRYCGITREIGLVFPRNLFCLGARRDDVVTLCHF